MRPTVYIAVLLTALSLSGCDGTTVTPAGADGEISSATSAQFGASCAACAQATLSIAATEKQSTADSKAAATAAIVRVNSQVTLDSANATLSAAQSQQQNKANLLAAQITATAEIVQVSIQATLDSSGSTQIAAMTQSQYDLQATQTQQIKNDLAAATQTAVANAVATQTQVAVAISQGQALQLEEEKQASIAFLWTWFLPIFIVCFAVLALWGFWRWIQISQANQRLSEYPLNRLPTSPAEISHQYHRGLLPYLESDIVDNDYALTTPQDNEVDHWVEEIKSKLLSSERKANDDNTDN